MAVLAEAISVVVRFDAILQRLPGGEEAFQSMVTNDTYCTDGAVRADHGPPLRLHND